MGNWGHKKGEGSLKKGNVQLQLVRIPKGFREGILIKEKVGQHTRLV